MEGRRDGGGDEREEQRVIEGGSLLNLKYGIELGLGFAIERKSIPVLLLLTHRLIIATESLIFFD